MQYSSVIGVWLIKRTLFDVQWYAYRSKNNQLNLIIKIRRKCLYQFLKTVYRFYRINTNLCEASGVYCMLFTESQDDIK